MAREITSRKKSDLQGVPQGGLDDAALLAVAVILLTEVVDVLVDLFFPEPADQKIQQKAGDGSQGRLSSQDLQNGSQVHCLGDKKWAAFRPKWTERLPSGCRR